MSTTFQISNASHDFLHPCEHKILESIVKIADNQIDVAKFVRECNGEITSKATGVHDGKNDTFSLTKMVQ